jgi:DNA ligase (NAD+)
MHTADTVDALVARLEECNSAYRAGTPIISDHEYDALVEQLEALAPLHPFLNRVEPERFESKREIRHPEPMLSIEKA